MNGNLDFRPTPLTWVNLAILILAYPALSLLGSGPDVNLALESMSQGLLAFMLITTVLVQWMLFLINYGGVYTERTGLAGLAFRPPRWIDLAWAGAFLVGANLILTGLAWFLAQVGLPVPGEIGMLIPTEPFGKFVWVIVSFTAGFCEEVAFRGYLMTRIRLLGRFQNWVIPTAISAVVFGICHAYQGIPGFILITAYGVMFSLLYIRTGSIWPGIIAHSMHDLGALFWPH